MSKWKSSTKVGRSTSTSWLKKQRTLVVSSNGALGVLEASACISWKYSPTWARVCAWHNWSCWWRWGRIWN
jgi:hypothetical protein